MRRLLAVWLACAVPSFAQDAAPGAPDPEARVLAHVRQLTFAGKRAGESYFSADGKRVVYQAERDGDNPFYQIYSLELATGEVTRISTGVGKTTCAWFTPDGGRVLFASTHEDPDFASKVKAELGERERSTARRYAWDYDEHYEVFVREVASGVLTKLTNVRGYDAECSMSPDGKRIAFASNRHAFAQATTPDEIAAVVKDPARHLEIHVMDADGGNVRRLTDCDGYDGGPMWSPDGASIVWRRFSPDGTTAEVWRMGADGANPRQLTRLGALSWAPFFHPSGEYVVFATNRHGPANFELYLVDAMGEREPVRATTTPGFDGLPSFSPDGESLTWTSTRGTAGAAQVFIARWSHEGARELLGFTAPATADPGEARAAEAGDADAAAATDAPAAVDVRRYVERLCSDAYDGRLTGTDGERRATRYVAQAFARLGLEPAGADGWFEPFTFTAGVGLGSASRLAVVRPGAKGADKAVDVDWRPLAFSAAGVVGAAEVVFAGYGIVAPSAEGQPAHDDYGPADAKGKWVLVLRYSPEDVPSERRQYLARYASLRHKAMVARDKGAVGMLVVSGPSSKVAKELVPLQADASLATASIAAASISDALAGVLLEAGGAELAATQLALDKGDALKALVPCGALKVEAAISLEREERRGRSVLARLRAKAPTGDGACVLVGAHVDHLGRSTESSSRARPEERGRVHRGADDNASGVAALLEIAQALAGQVARGEVVLVRDVVFAAWSGEELGLIGSTEYANRGVTGDPARRGIAAVLNLDMVGRYRGSLQLQGAGSSTAWPALVERAAAPVGLAVELSASAYLPTDSTPFYLRGVPTLSAFTGTHDEYHSPRDTPDTLDYAAAAAVARLMGRLAADLARRDTLIDHVRQSAPAQGPSRAGARVSLGTIPAYGAAGPGLVLDGVAKGGAAERAGLTKGDRIVELAGKKIDNVYDYMHVIGTLKPGVAAKVVVVRGEARLELEVVPVAKE